MTSEYEKESLETLAEEVYAFPLSYAQQRLWFLNQLEPDSPVYNQFKALKLRGRLNREALQKALDTIVERHKVLRTTFLTVDDKPAQVIHEPDNVELSVIDLLRDLIEHRQEALDRLMSEIIRRPFDLEKDWPLRTALIQLGNDEHVLLLVAHHIASDGWSNDILFRELSALYEAFCQGKRSPLEKLPVQYADYAVWQEEWLQGEILQQQLSYWKKQLEDISPLELPTDRPRPAVQGHLGRTKTFTFPQASAESLKALSRQEGVTLFMTLLAAFQILLHRYTAQDDIAVGCPIAGRNRMEFEGLIGFFVNTLVLRNDFSGNPMFRQFLARVKEDALDAYAHQDIPFEKLVAELQPARDLSRNPFFQVLFQLRNYPARTVSAAGLNIEDYEFYSDIAKFDLSVALRDTGIGLSGTIEYRTDLFDSATIERMVGHYQRMLEGIVADPTQRISELALLSDAEKRQLLVEWNDTETDYPKDKCIHELFEAQVEKTPDAIAVVFEDQQLTYRELNTRANHLAHHLRKRGVRPESLVAVCMERSLEMVIGILGVVKAGGAYVPIDPDTPTDRLKFMLQDAQAALILTQEKFSSYLVEFGNQRICLDSAGVDLSQESKENFENGVNGKNAVYMIYTSGSTGTPKGVLNVHGGLLNRLQWMQQAYRLAPSDRILQKTPFTFDVSVWEFFWPLISGARLVIARPGGHRDSAYLVQLIKSERITLLHFVPSMLGMFLQEEGVESCATLRQVICSGEALSYELQQRFFERTGVALSNLYGPTEASIDVTAWECRSDSDRTIVPIGQPIANTQVYILDGDLNPLPIGVVGEIYIGGDGVARGYLNRPELTAEKFIPDPFSNEPGARIYKTGDLARYLPDGNIDFLGRTDHQVKIRGYRIELGEIEAVLAQHPTIKESVVLAREDTAGDQRLVAYVVGAGGSQPSAHDLRRFLQQKLPEYMVPSTFIFLESLPLTPSGKLDRKALPAPDQTRPELEETYSPPRTPVEESLAQIWCDVLKLDQVGVHDNFFDLGGHSLLATQLISRIRDTFKLDLPLRSLFEAPTVGEFAARIGSAHERKVQSRSLSILPGPLNKEYLMSFSQERFWFLERLEPNNSAYKIDFELNLTGSLDIEALEKSLAEIARRHESLRTTCHESHGVPVQIVSEQWSFRLNVIDVRQVVAADLETEVRRLLEKEYRRPFNLSTDLLLRGTLLRLSGSEHLLLISSHHVAWDHWSIAVFFRELSVLYQAFAAGKPSPLVELPIQYKHYALWQRENVQGTEFDNQLAYWKRQLADIPSRLDLPADHPHKPLSARRGGRQALVLPKELSSALRFLGKEANVTLFMIFLAAYQTLLHRITGEDDIVVGTPVAGRDRYETEGLIGLFLNSLAMRANFSSNPSFLELLARVREVALEAYEHQDLPFEKLVEELQPARDLTTTPIFQVFINMYNFKEDELNLAGLTVQPLKRRADAPQFDLELYIREHPDGTHLSFVYDSELFEAKTIERMMGHFRILLEGIVGNPEQRISEMPLLTDAEKHQLLVEWNDTHKDYPKDKCIHELFETQVEHTPDAIALIFEDQQLTYRELNTRANQLALYLRHIGVGPDVLVGLCVERSIEMIVGLLGILKAGGAYVPLDPAYPKERLAFMLEDAKVKVLLTQQQFLSSINHPRVVCLDDDWHKIATQSTHNPKSNINAHNLAYVIYTSGSTGIPKGVAVEHRQLINYLWSVIERLDLRSQRSYATVSTLAADLGNTVIFSSLCTGAVLHAIARDRIADSEAMADYFSRHAVDCLKIVPSHLAALQSVSHPERVLPRQLLILGGEASDIAWVKHLTALAPSCRIFNHYGPTETTVGVMTYAVQKDALPIGLLHLPLGRPITNTQVYILDQYLNPVPIGVAGELYVGGSGLARGYLNRPELTNERFSSNPFSDQPGARLYKTGDRCRYLADGNIEFLGRTDNQIKLRGYRIEPAEIETALTQHPEVQEAVVLDRTGINGEKQLAAYVVVAPDRAPTVAGKPRYRLPNGMAVVQLNKNETDYIYQEIFERQAYLRHGITVRDGDCIFDVGANIGLFTLFAHQISKEPTTYAFEPNPAVYAILQANAKLYASRVRLFNCGLSNETKRTTFTFFPDFSLLSGFYADAQAEKEVVKTFIVNQQKAGLAEMTELVEQADAILANRFSQQSFSAELCTVSSIIEREDIESIDLLKINVEKSELDVLKGIKHQDWLRIKQIVLEVDVKENLPIITSLLETYGYEHIVEQDNLLEGTSLCYVYAIRPSAERRLIREQSAATQPRILPVFDRPPISAVEVSGFLASKLPSYMIPSSFVFLDALPLTLNGKVDRQTLIALGDGPADQKDTFDAPRTPVEAVLAQIWCDVLNVRSVGIHDNFFELGGHSLLATQLISRVRDALKIDLPLRKLFEAPTVGEFAEQIGLTRDEKTQIRTEPILPEAQTEEFPLSFSQERFWFLEQLEPNNFAYKVPYGFHLSGPLKMDALEQSLSEVVCRHETLRTTLRINNYKLVQHISDPDPFELSIVDLRPNVAGDLDSEVQRIFETEYGKPFDLSSDFMLRATLLRLHTDENVLLINTHHVAWDHWSIAVFFRELSVLYQAFAAGKPSPLVELPIQYKHYALWQRENVQGTEFDNQLAYWKRQLADIPSRLDLPADHPHKPLSARRGGRQALVLPKELSSALRFLGKEANVTLFMIFLAAYQTLLHRITGEDDIVVGTPVAGRDRYETEGLIGLFLNSLAMRANFSSNPSFLELLARVREVALEAYEHQDLPFEKLVEELQPARDLTTTPIFQVFINMYNFKEDELNLAGLTVQPLKRRADAPQFDLELYIREHPDGTHLSFVYDSELFEAKTIERMMGHFRILLEGIVGNPEQRISEMPLLTDAEKHQLLVEWNDTHKDYPKDKCIHELFETQVEHTPDAIALIFEDQQLTYRELNTRANQLALYLRHIGVGPDVLVGLCVERSIEMIVGLLGILKAGGAYVPLDPAYPKERLAFMLEDAKVKVLLTQQQFLSSINHPRVVCLDDDWHKIATQSTHNPKSNINAHNLAYVIYTSGSTGIPKGVMIQHRSVVNFLASMAREPGLSETDILLAVTTVSFDIAGLEIYLSLSVGARVVLARREVAADGSRLAQLLSDSDATAIQATPATWLMLLASGWQGSRELKILCGGEALRGDLATQLEQSCASLWNMYGPTETTIWSAVQKVTANVDGVSLGRPIANTQIYILDKYMNPVPIGVPGELHIGGDGLARGYWNCPELTQEKFIANPFSDRPSARLYKTGDVARYFPDGNIEFLGRVDHQVKIRGYRIELGEIEATLGQHPSIRESIVLAREDIPGNLRLVAYVVAAPGCAPSANELRGFLQQKLPEYMVPAAFMFLDCLPLTPNGKLDRKALPAPDQTRPELEETYSAPRTPVEDLLAQIWSDVLKLDQVGIHDNFFELGGHSLVATQLISRIRDTFKLDFPLRSLFEAPTIYGLAERVQELGEKQDVMQERKITRVEREQYRVQ